MNTHPRFLPRALACAALCALAPVLAGCSGVVSNLNSAQVTVPNVNVANPFGLDKQAVAVAVANAAKPALRPHAAGPHAGPNVNTFSFPNQSPVGLAAVKSAQLSFALVPRVTADGTGLPAHFTLSALTVDGVVSDADGKGNGGSVVLTQLTAGGPLSFTQQADGSYLADAGTIKLAQQSKTTDPALSSLLSIVTGGPTPNVATLTLNAASAGLPDGTLLHLTFDTTTLTVSASQ